MNTVITDHDCSICSGSFDENPDQSAKPFYKKISGLFRGAVVKEKAIVTVLESCEHPFHTKCIKDWAIRSRTCPLCRLYITDQHIITAIRDKNTQQQLLNAAKDGELGLVRNILNSACPKTLTPCRRWA